MLKITIHNIKDYSGKELEKLNKCVEVLTKVINSNEFKNRVLSFSHYQTTCTGRLWWKKCNQRLIEGFRFEDADGFLIDKLTNQQVLDIIMSGKESLSSDVDHEIDLNIIVTTDIDEGVLGYTYPDTMKQWVAKWYFNSSSIPELCNNIMHEWTHKLGFDHAFNNHSLRRSTVPYAIGDIVEELAELYI